MAINGKKAIVFSLMAIGLSGLFIILFSNIFQQPIDDRNDIITTRISALDQGIDDFYEFAAEAQRIAIYEALNALYKEINDSGPPYTYLGEDNFEQRLSDCTLASINCDNPNNLSAIINNYTQTMQQALQTKVSSTQEDLRVDSEDYFTITTTSTINITLTDTYANWSTSKNITVTTSTTGVYDPAYLRINQLYNGNNYPTITPNERYSDEEWNIDIFTQFVTANEYRGSINGSCLSHRFEGDFTTRSSECGIESVVDPDEYELLKDIVNQNITHLDHQVLRREERPCTGTNERVGIKALNKNITLAVQDAIRYNLDNNSIWYYNETLNELTARGCTGFN